MTHPKVKVRVWEHNLIFLMPNFGVINTQADLVKLIEMGVNPFFPITDIYSNQVIEVPIIITSLPYPRPDLGDNILFLNCIKRYDWGECKDTYSLRDHNIEYGGYNDHHLFATKEGADLYVKHLKKGGCKLPRMPRKPRNL